MSFFLGDGLAEGILTALGRSAWQGSLAIAVVYVIERTWVSLPETWRAWMWRLVFLKLAASLLISAHVPLPVLPASAVSLHSEGGQQTATTASNALPTAEVIQLAESRAGNWPWVLLGLWLCGCTASLYCQRRAGLKVLAGLRSSRSIVAEDFYRPLTIIAARMGLPGVPPIRWVSALGSPCLLGAFKPIILVPLDWLSKCTPEHLQLAIAHELAHVARRDLIWNRLVAACQAIFFFHPLVWLASRRYLLAQEVACDALVLQRTQGSPREYAQLLLEFVAKPAGPQWGGSAAITGASVTLRERIVAMNRASSIQRPTWFARLALSLLLAAGMVPMSLAQQSPGRSPSENDNPRIKSAPSGKVKKSASASASSSSSAQGFAGGQAGGGAVGGGGPINGLDMNFNGGEGFGLAENAARAIAQAQAEAKASVAIGGTEESRQQSSPSDSDSPNEVPLSKASRMKQSMSSTNDGTGEKWSRTTEVSEGNREILIEESQDQIEVTITEGGKETTIIAKDAAALQEKSPSAFAIYRKYVKNRKSGSAANAVGGGNAFGGAGGNAFGGGNAGGNAGGIAGGIPGAGFGAFPEGFPQGAALPEADPQAVLRQFQQLIDDAANEHPELKDALKDLAK